MEEDEGVTKSLNEMLDSKNIETIKMAKDIIVAQPDLTGLKWYELDEVVPIKKRVKVAELYFKDKAKNSDKVYIVSIEKTSKKDYFNVETYYGRRGKTLTNKTRAVDFPDWMAESEFKRTIQEKLKKGY